MNRHACPSALTAFTIWAFASVAQAAALTPATPASPARAAAASPASPLRSVAAALPMANRGRTPGTSAPGTSVNTAYAQQAAAATLTAQSNPNCARARLGDYYWEVGDVNGVQVSGSVGTAIGATTGLSIDSATKWVYASAAVQYYGGSVPAAQIPYLNFTSGYSNFGIGRCLPSDTVAGCIARNKPTLDSTAVGKFFYGAAHMQLHANDFMSLGPALNAGLNAGVLLPVFNISSLGTLGYSSPLMAGAVYTSASTYGSFLRRILSGTLLMKDALGTHKVCTNPRTCSTAKFSPMQKIDESWNYSLGHWVEDDPLLGDHAFSSGGAGGFYPWIDKNKTFYGVLARQTFAAGTNDGYVSAQCGRLIRQAFITGVAVTTATKPTPAR